MRYVLFFLCSLLDHLTWGADVVPSAVGPFLEGARQVILIDADTGDILLSKNADEKMAPSSMTKIITVMPVFQRLQDKKIALTDQLPVSVRAWQQEGSRMFVNPNTYVSIDDLLKGIIIQSGNDATTVLAEGLSGSEAQFAHEMTEFAKALGATNTNFVNASGLPDPQHYSTARDLALCAQALLKRYPEYYPLFSVIDFKYNGIKQGNRNPLLYKKGIPIDGIKTGMTDGGGYGIVASGELSGLRLILVANGMRSVNERSRIAEGILTWGMRTFKKQELFKANTPIVKANVWLGEDPTVTLRVAQDVTVLLSQAELGSLKAQAHYDSPLAAPLAQGQVCGQLMVHVPGRQNPLMVPLVAAKSVAEVGMMKRALAALHYCIWGTSKA